LIDYDSVLSNQRELVYKQRDQILKNLDNVQILKKMVDVVAKDIVKLFVLPNNEMYVDDNRIAFALNSKVLNTNLISPETFKNKNVNESEEIITNIINLSIDKRIELLGLEQSKNILKDILIQNLDFQ
jgi:preprotein translocase subunit SecA